MSPIQQMIVAVLTSSAFTGAVLEGARSFARWRERKKNKGMAKVINDIDLIKAETGRTVGEVEKIGKRLDHQREIDKVLLHDAMHRMYYDLKDDEDITLEDKSNLDYVMEEYIRLKGNHKAEIMYEVLSKKPIRKEIS